VDQISGTASTDAQAQAQDQGQPADAAPHLERIGFRSRGRARRRARFLRRARELAYRDLGGLVFNLHRFGQRNDPLVLAKLTTIGQIDAQLRQLEGALQERRPVTVLREAGITACARCAAIHSSEDGFCPNCGLPVSRHVDLPIAGAAATAAAAQPATGVDAPAPVAERGAPAQQPFGAPPQPPSPPPADPARAPTPARAPLTPAVTGAPATPAGGRSPASSGSTDDDRPTEILHPPVPGS
jgi:hypothetical protein